MLSIIIDDKVMNFSYRAHGENIYVFKVGDLLVGQIFKIGKNNWTGICSGECDIRMLRGFRSRYSASAFMLKSKGLTNGRDI